MWAWLRLVSAPFHVLVIHFFWERQGEEERSSEDLVVFWCVKFYFPEFVKNKLSSFKLENKTFSNFLENPIYFYESLSNCLDALVWRIN